MADALSINVNVGGDKAFMGKLSGMLSDVTNFETAFEAVGEQLVEYYAGQVFESQGGVLGTPWKELSASTTAFKAKHYRQFTTIPLQATGTMRQSFKHKARPLSLEITNEASYFKYHQSTLPRHKIPRRPMLAINKDVKSIIKHTMERVLRERLVGL